MDNTHSQSGGRAPTAVEDISQDQPSTYKDQPATSKHKPSTSQDQEHSKDNLERRSALNESAQQITTRKMMLKDMICYTFIAS